MRVLFLLVLVALVGCTTPYGPRSISGGYKERMVDDDTYIVSFFGNGYTSGQQVWNFWIYRCAELTLEKGYTLFSLSPSDEHALKNDPDAHRLVKFQMLEDSVASSDHIKDDYKQVMYYYTTVTTYSSKAVVDMYKPPFDGVTEMLVDAQTIIDLLKPYVDSQAKAPAPEQKDLMVRASLEAMIKAKKLSEEDVEKLKEEAGVAL